MLAIAATAIGFAWVQAQWDTIQLFAGQYANQPQYTKWFLGDRPFYQMTRVFTKDALYVATAIVCPWMVLLMLRGRRRSAPSILAGAAAGRRCVLGRNGRSDL